VDLLAQAPRKAEPLRTLGPHPSDGEPVTLHKGRYGPYLKHGRLNASLPRSVESDAVTMEQAVEILNAQAAKKGAKKTTKKASTKKPAAKKSTAKKPSANKAAAKLEAG
jgi:DNA topoisomerase-1